jgi:hypothetical protein
METQTTRTRLFLARKENGDMETNTTTTRLFVTLARWRGSSRVTQKSDISRPHLSSSIRGFNRTMNRFVFPVAALSALVFGVASVEAGLTPTVNVDQPARLDVTWSWHPEVQAAETSTPGLANWSVELKITGPDAAGKREVFVKARHTRDLHPDENGGGKSFEFSFTFDDKHGFGPIDLRSGILLHPLLHRDEYEFKFDRSQASQNTQISLKGMHVEKFPLAAKANRVGETESTSAQVRISGTFPFSGAIDLSTSTVTIDDLLNEMGGAGELGQRVSTTLTARPGGNPNAAIYETPDGIRPTFRMEIKNRDPENPVFEFNLRVDRATISAFPELCEGEPPTTDLTTSFSIDDGVNPPVVVSTVQRWRCLDLIGGDPEKPRSLRVP